MNIYAVSNIKELIKDNPYVGRGIIIGKTADGKKAAFLPSLVLPMMIPRPT